MLPRLLALRLGRGSNKATAGGDPLRGGCLYYCATVILPFPFLHYVFSDDGIHPFPPLREQSQRGGQQDASGGAITSLFVRPLHKDSKSGLGGRRW